MMSCPLPNDASNGDDGWRYSFELVFNTPEELQAFVDMLRAAQEIVQHRLMTGQTEIPFCSFTPPLHIARSDDPPPPYRPYHVVPRAR